MKRDFEDDGYMDGGPSRGRFGGTSDFSTTIISDDGRFLGMKLSPELASQARTIYPAFLDWARRKGEKYGVPLAEKFATRALNHDPIKAKKFGGKAGDVIGYSIILGNQILDVGRNVYDSAHSLNELRSSVRPLARQPETAALSGNNEVVSNARSKINGVFWLRLTSTLTGAIATAPALMLKFSEQKVRNQERAVNLELDGAKTPDEVAEVLRKRLTVGGDGLELEGHDIREGIERLIEGERAAYKSRMAKYVAAKKVEAEGAIKGVVESITHENIRSKVRELDKLGVDTRALQSALQGEWDYASRRHVRPSEESIGEAIAEFKTDVNHSLAHYVQETLEGRFVKQNGAFDDEQVHFLEGEDRRRGTIRDAWLQRIESLREKDEDPRIKDGDSEKMGVMLAGFGAGLGAELASKALGAKKLEKYRQPIALDRILHLRRELEKAGEHPPEEVPGMTANGRTERDISYAKYVHQIFQQHQKDCKRTEIGTRFIEHFENASWDDGAIQQLPDEQLTSYELAVKTIAKRIKDGRMDAIALITLVGDKERKIVRDDGRSFGPRSAMNETEEKAAIMHLIDEQTVLLHANHSKTASDPQERLGDFVFSIEDMKRAMTSPEMDSQQRSFIFTVFSNVIGNDKKLCEMIGISTEQCAALRAESKDHFSKLLDAAVDVLADMIEKDPDTLAQHIKFTDSEKDLIRQLAGRMHEEGKDAADLTANREEVKKLETVVTNATMALRNRAGDGQSNFWQRLVEGAKSVPGMLADVKKRREENNQPASTPSEYTADIDEQRFADKHEPRRGGFADEDGPVALTDRAARNEEPAAPRLG